MTRNRYFRWIMAEGEILGRALAKEKIAKVSHSTADTASAEHVFRTVPEWFAAQFDPALAMIIASDDPEGPHQARVALRRLRAILAGYSDILSPKVSKKLQHRCRQYFRLIGLVRDADILGLHLKRKADIKTASRDNEALRQAVRRALTDKGAQKFSVEFARLVDARRSWRTSAKAVALRNDHVEVLAARALHSAFAKARRYPIDPSKMNAETRHDFRKDMKTLRYLTDHFSMIGPSPAREHFIGLLRNLQDILGDLNDAKLAKAAGLATLVNEADLLAESKGFWQAIVAAGPWWLSPCAKD